jgi:hypothetical protein
MFDAMTYIYTACVQDMFTTREYELYLYQLRTIFNVLGTTVGRYFGRKVPSTVAATWCEVGQGRPLVAGFAASCTGREKPATAKARRDYLNALVKLANPTDKTVLNLLGNCPEFITWSIVCRNAGNYKSLCLSNFKEFAYKFCGHCKDASVAFSEKKYEIEDFFDKSSLLFSTEVMTDQAYPGCKLKTAQAICQPAACENGVLVESESTYGFIIFYSLCICILMNHGVERLNFPHLHGD